MQLRLSEFSHSFFFFFLPYLFCRLAIHITDCWEEEGEMMLCKWPPQKYSS